MHSGAFGDYDGTKLKFKIHGWNNSMDFVKMVDCELFRVFISKHDKIGLVKCKRLQHLDFLDDMPKLRNLEIDDCPLLSSFWHSFPQRNHHVCFVYEPMWQPFLSKTGICGCWSALWPEFCWRIWSSAVDSLLNSFSSKFLLSQLVLNNDSNALQKVALKFRISIKFTGSPKREYSHSGLGWSLSYLWSLHTNDQKTQSL